MPHGRQTPSRRLPDRGSASNAPSPPRTTRSCGSQLPNSPSSLLTFSIACQSPEFCLFPQESTTATNPQNPLTSVKQRNQNPSPTLVSAHTPLLVQNLQSRSKPTSFGKTLCSQNLSKLDFKHRQYKRPTTAANPEPPLRIADGNLCASQSISPYSGHYQPIDDSLDNFLSFLNENGVNLDEIEIRKANEDYENFEESKFNREEIAAELSTNSESPQLHIPKEEEKDITLELTEAPETETKSNYRRTLSGGLHSPRAEVPKKAILERINS